MLSSDFQTTPRPKPPAKARRSSRMYTTNTSDWQSPPPYALREVDTLAVSQPLPTLLGSPIAATSQLIYNDESWPSSLDFNIQEGVREKSREELEELLRRANLIIKEREQELNDTSEMCRELAESNATLKTRNDSLIHRLPSSRPSSPLYSSSPPYSSPPIQSRSGSPLLSGYSSLAPPRRRRHARHVSSTPAELAALADQNAELLTKLADLEAEATHSEQAGKRRLRALENEIEILREELERSRTESVRLQEESHSQDESSVVLNAELTKMYKKLAREAKVRELKAKTRPWDVIEEDTTKDFAPKSLTPGLPFTSKLVAKESPNLSPQTPDAKISDSRPTSKGSASLDSLLSSTISSTNTSSREQALVSQLLLKIRELEETNKQLAADHLTSRMRLRHAQTETESVRRLCEFIGNEVDLDLELEILDSEDGEAQEIYNKGTANKQKTPRRAKTIRLRPVSRVNSMDFTKSKSVGRMRRYSSVECLKEDLSPTTPSSNLKESMVKKRKPISGSFEAWSDTSNQVQSSLIDHEQSLDSNYPIAGESLDGFLNDNRPDHVSDTHESEEVQDQQNVDLGNDRMPSLGSELGLQLQGLIPAPFHTRTTSIADLLRVAEISSPIQTSPSFKLPLPFPSMSSGEESYEEPANTSQEGMRHLTNPRLRRMREDGSSRRTLSVASMPGALEDFSLEIDNDIDISDTSTSFETTLHTPSTPTNNSPRTPSLTLTSTPNSSRRTPITHQPSSRSLRLNDSKPRNKYASLLVEIWLWLQFVVVIVVVVCAMARVGPKGVFRNPPSSTTKKNTR